MLSRIDVFDWSGAYDDRYHGIQLAECTGQHFNIKRRPQAGTVFIVTSCLALVSTFAVRHFGVTSSPSKTVNLALSSFGCFRMANTMEIDLGHRGMAARLPNFRSLGKRHFSIVCGQEHRPLSAAQVARATPSSSGNLPSSAAATAPPVLVVGSLNVDLYHKMPQSSIKLDGKPIDMSPIKGMTLPAKSFVENTGVAAQLKSQGLVPTPGQEEALLLAMGGPFEQKTGGKGANAAAAAAQTSAAELICNFGIQSAKENEFLLADLKEYGNVNTKRSATIDGPTGTAYILLFPDNDNAILLLGGANQAWGPAPLADEGSDLYKAISESVALMLQREVPQYVNLEVARAAKSLGKPVFMDVGGTDAPLDEALLPYITVICPNESELTFISGVETIADGKLQKSLLRKAVAALKAKFAAVDNPTVEVLVTLGSKGSMHFASEWSNSGAENSKGLLAHETSMGTFALETKDGKPADTTGAGDCFRGSYVAARYGQDMGVADAMRWAAAAGSLSVEVQGAMPSMPVRNAIGDRFKKDVSNGWR